MSNQFIQKIKENNATHVVTLEELQPLLKQAQAIHAQHHQPTLRFERSIFINWTCAIADCQYCYLSTKPKHKAGTDPKAIRSQASILAEALLCQLMGWDIGYITGGLRVESVDYLIELIKKINIVTNKKTVMNFGPYAKSEILKLKPYIGGMGMAIESFEEELHNFICPSKPLRSLIKSLEVLKENNMEKFITIILGIGEHKNDIEKVIENIKKYEITNVQLCFLKPQEHTIFANIPAPDPLYMAWWIAKLRIACPTLKLRVALVRDRIEDLSLYCQAGINAFSRFMIFKDFGSPLAQKLQKEAQKAQRELQGNFITLPPLDTTVIDKLPFEEKFKQTIKEKLEQYYHKLEKLLHE